MQQLEASLDERGILEGGLKRALQAEMAVLLTDLAAEPPPPPIAGDEGWLEEGPHVGERVRLLFPGVGESEGTVVRYLPPDADDPPLWHIEHDDGDEARAPAHLTSPRDAGRLRGREERNGRESRAER